MLGDMGRPLPDPGGYLRSDHLIPASLNRANYQRYRESPSVTEFKEFPGRVHYLIGQQGWEEVADYALNWAARAEAGESARAA